MRTIETGRVCVKGWQNPCSVVIRQSRVLMFISSGPSDPFYISRIKKIASVLDDHPEALGWHWANVRDGGVQKGVYISLPFSHHKNSETPIEFLQRLTGLEIRPADKSTSLCHD